MNSLQAHRAQVKVFLLATTIFLVVLIAILSMIYFTTPRYNFTINQAFLGWIGWVTLTISTLLVSFKYKKECFFVFLLFFTFGFFSKAYLEPVSDQIDHLCRTQEKCRNIDTGDRVNRGLWQYNMNSLFLCDGETTNKSPENKLFSLDILHGLYISFASTILYTISRNTGLPAKWSFFSVIIAILFMGTNKFSYFRYYSYGPSFTSLCIYYLWISFFFFSDSKKAIILGLFLLLPLIIIILVNHLQEAVFLIFISSFWVIFCLTEKLYCLKNKNNILLPWTIILLSLFFIFPQFQWFEKIFSLLPISNIWEKNQSIVYYWNSIHIMGKIWLPQYRVADTVGLLGFAPLALTPLILLFNQSIFSKSMLARIILLGILPFLIFCIPFYHYIWVAHVQIPVYYRIAYSSLFWVPIASFFYQVEILIKNHLNFRLKSDS